jgi:Protein kinase domain
MQVESLGRYRIEKELGRGAMGRVFLAYDPQIDRRVAVKTVQIFASLPEADRVQARERFLREARSAGKLLHPGIVTIFDVGDVDGVPYLAMEFIEGETLDGFCRRETLLPVPDALALVAAAADALAFAHERGIVHRDIKPANLMRVGLHAVKIMDFGLAKSAATSMTHDGALFGTPSYMSPEQVRGDPLDGRTDLFSLGVVCHELLTGVKPFGGDSISSVLYRIVHEPPAERSGHSDRVTPALSAWLDRALAKDPNARFPDGAAFSAALKQAAAASGSGARPPARPSPATAAPLPSVPPASLEEPADKPARRSAVRWIAGSAVGALMLGAAVMAALGRFAPHAPPLLEARVRTEPVGLPVRLNGSPLEGDRVQFAGAGPYGVLSAVQGCREAKHRVDPADAGNDIVLVLDAVRAEVPVDPGVPGANVTVNDGPPNAVPATLDLDLCRDNAIVVAAPGYQTATVTIPARSTPLSARTAGGAIRLQPIPTGRLILPAARVDVRYFIDGKPVARTAAGEEVPAGSHVVRAVDEARFIDVAATLDVPAGATADPKLSIPAIARLAVQSFPPNCRVALKRAGAQWRPIGETPLKYELGAGRYALRIESPVSGESREQEIDLTPGTNAPIRISFGKSSR